MSETTEIVTRPTETGEIQTYPEGNNPVAAMLNAVIKQGVTQENVAAMKELVALYERVEDRNAAKEFAAAKAALQAELPKVTANKYIPNKDGTLRSRFADYEQIKEVVTPYLVKHGFSTSISLHVTDDGKRVIAKCKLQHHNGHSETNECAIRIGNGPPSSSDAQADGSAYTYAKRTAFCAMLDIAVDKDTDARREGEYITPEQVESLRQRVQACGANEAMFLKYAGATTYEHIREGKYSACEDMLLRKERAMKGKTTQEKVESAGMSTVIQGVFVSWQKLQKDGGDFDSFGKWAGKVLKTPREMSKADNWTDDDIEKVKILLSEMKV